MLPQLRSQFLQLVIDFPNRSSTNLRHLTLIWEAFLRWCREQFDSKIGVKVLGMGEFCFRKDTIGNLEFLNPMFVMSEGFARSFGLNDRRPKTHTVQTDSIDLDMSAIATLATVLIGEVIGRDVVDAALRDVIDKIGQVCSEPDKYGLLTLDFGFAKLFSDNKSLEFMFGDTKKKDRPDTGSSVRSLASLRSSKRSPSLPPIHSSASSDVMSIDGNSIMNVPGMAQLKRDQMGSRPATVLGRPADAPMQRAHRPHIKPVKNIHNVTKQELAKSYDAQMAEKANIAEQRREQDHQSFLSTLQRLRKEMNLERAQQDMRKKMGQVLADHQHEQQKQKRERDVAARQVRWGGMVCRGWSSGDGVEELVIQLTLQMSWGAG